MKGQFVGGEYTPLVRYQYIPVGIVVCVILSFILSACKAEKDPETTISLATTQPTALNSQGAEQVATTFLDAWEDEDYPTMYAMISPNARDAFNQKAFVDVYGFVDNLLNIRQMDWEVRGVLVEGSTAQIAYRITFETRLLGTFSDPTALDATRAMQLVATSEGWRVAWSREDIFAGWTNDSNLSIERQMPKRGNIYDREGRILVDQNGVVVQIYLVKNRIPDLEACQATLSRVFEKELSEIQTEFERHNQDALFLMGEVNQDTINVENDELDTNCAPQNRARSTRQYYEQVAPHLLGYVGKIPDGQQAEYELLGYPPDAVVGLEGIEKAFEDQLSGTIGVQLNIRAGNGRLVRTIAERLPSPGESVYLTLDRDLQLGVQQLLVEAYEFAQPTWAQTSPGAAIVMMDVNTGEILAIASYPDYDASLFNPDTPNPDATRLIEEYKNDRRNPLVNRALQGRYPLGSVFKVFTMAAGLDSGIWSVFSSVNCTGRWYGEQFGDITRTDWYTPGHGVLNSTQAIIASCNPFFWTMAVALNNEDPYLLPNYARQFGFGSPVNMQGILSDPGNVPDPDNKPLQTGGVEWAQGDASNLAIGQGLVAVNPLQVVRGIAAIANGGMLWDPLVVERVQLIGQGASQVFEATGTRMDIDPEVFADIRDGMCQVTTNQTIGTAEYIFGEWQEYQNFAVSVCGKTGTAQSGQFQPHAWFGAFAPADNPQVAIVVVVENSCEGSEVSAPIVRRILELYYDLDQDFGWPSFWQGGCVQIGPT